MEHNSEKISTKFHQFLSKFNFSPIPPVMDQFHATYSMGINVNLPIIDQQNTLRSIRRKMLFNFHNKFQTSTHSNVYVYEPCTSKFRYWEFIYLSIHRSIRLMIILSLDLEGSICTKLDIFRQNELTFFLLINNKDMLCTKHE